jgi:hypothetical protein
LKNILPLQTTCMSTHLVLLYGLTTYRVRDAHHPMAVDHRPMMNPITQLPIACTSLLAAEVPADLLTHHGFSHLKMGDLETMAFSRRIFWNGQVWMILGSPFWGPQPHVMGFWTPN